MMYTQFFGYYLLGKNIINNDQLLAAMAKQASTHMKLGAMAVHAGYMTAGEVEQVIILQTHHDKRFGELSVEYGYLTQEQVDELLEKQIPEFVLLGQILVENGILTPSQLENEITDYRSEYEIFDLDMNIDQKEMILHLLQDIDITLNEACQQYIVNYLLLLFNNLIRFIGDDFTPLNILKMPEIPTTHCVKQELTCPLFHVTSALNMNEDSSIIFASRYAKEDFTEFDEYVRASKEDFLNLHNGLFVVNLSNEYAVESTLLPPEEESNEIFSPGEETYLFPILYPFGIIHFIFSVQTPEE